MYSHKWNCAALLFPKQNYNVLSPNFHIHVSVSNLYIARIGLPILLQPTLLSVSCELVLNLALAPSSVWMGQMLKLKCAHSPLNPRVLSSTSVPFTLTTVQVPNLALTHTKQITVKQADRSWEYINLSQIHECRNWEQGHTVSFLGIYKSDFRSSVGGLAGSTACSLQLT